MRRASFTCVAAFVATGFRNPVALTASQRNMFVYSEQSPVLVANQKALGSHLNVWLEDWETTRLKLKPKGNPTIISLEKGLELYNFSDLENPPEGFMEMPVHTSFATQKPYGRKMQLELSDRAMKKGFTSKYWISAGAVRKENYSLRFGSRATIVLSNSQVKLFHVSQLDDSERLARWPVSGGSRRPYQPTSEQFRALQENVALNGYQTGLFFTKRQAEALKLELAAGQSTFEIEVTTDGKGAPVYFNLDQLELPQAALESLNRTEPDVHSFLLSGEPVKKVELLPTHFKSKYWLSLRDAQMYNFAVKASETNKGVLLSRKTQKIEMVHVEQLNDVALGYQSAGHYVQ